ncbi:hypothetical protein [Pseudonocardia sp. DLS-67]
MLAPDIRPAASCGELTQLAGSVRRNWPHLPAPIALEWSDLPVVAMDRGTPWLYGPADRDPLMGAGGPAALPRGQRRRLEEVAASGPRFQAVAIAHELDPDGPARSLLPLLRNGPRTCTDEVARELVGPAPAHPGVVRAAGLLDSLCSGAAPAAAARALDALLDPIVFGVLATAPLVRGTPSLWFPIAVWRW